MALYQACYNGFSSMESYLNRGTQELTWTCGQLGRQGGHQFQDPVHLALDACVGWCTNTCSCKWQVMVWRTNFDRALEGYVLSAVQPAGAPPPAAFAASHPAPGPRAVPNQQPRQLQQQLAQQLPLPNTQMSESMPAEEYNAGHADGAKSKPVAWVLAGTKPTQPPSKETVRGSSKAGRPATAAVQSQPNPQRPGTSHMAAIPMQAAHPGRLMRSLASG